MTTTTINTGTYLLAILQERYNHHQWLADSYDKMAKEATSKKLKADFIKEFKKHHEQAIAIYCDVNKLDLMESNTENERQHIYELRKNYAVHKRMQEVEGK